MFNPLLSHTPSAGRLSSFLLPLAMMLLVGAVGCGDDDGDGDNLSGLDAPSILVSPSSFNFPDTPIGERETTTLIISNTGGSVLNITEMELIDESPTPQFRRGQGFLSTLQIPVGESHEFNVSYIPVSPDPARAEVRMQTNDPDNAEVIVELNTPQLGPQIFGNQAVRFNRVPAGEEAWTLTTIQNIGTTPLTISQILLGQNSDFDIAFPAPGADPADLESDTDQWPEVLEPGESFDIRIWFRPVNNNPSSGEITILSNDPNRSTFSLELIGNSGSPCMEVNQGEVLDFGASSAGQVGRRSIVITNCSAETPLELTNIFVSENTESVFDLNLDPLGGDPDDAPVIIDPSRSATFQALFAPISETASYEAKLTIESNDPVASPYEIALLGEGTDNECPVAVAEGRILNTTRTFTEGTALPLNTIELLGGSSFDPDGQVDFYEWTILESPENSQARVSPSPNLADPTLYLDLAGTYVVELMVYDNQGVASCGEPATVTIQAIPEDDVHIQLVWDAPGVANPTPEAGVDLDLHYLHPSGRWNGDGSVYWNNRFPNWGNPEDERDDPRLDIDDTCCGGPENINHSNPESGLEYGVGVYYFTDRGLGAAYATVRIYIRGELRFQLRNTYLPSEGYFWHVANIRWPSTDVYRRDVIDFGFPVQ
ncbi:choice-of-anchor D domain-containing protein [Lujinxingia vulgaris]|uniref:Choice-of-anchor D domain-containing protein n=1 Tax=Lujinxingia vulgaris TaxID=2600176 RepID=A0A5C6XET5_9DELT|nr:choice-of-anchor D domain-containing protein [Lujinxingia vulgaris]TXD37363.1 choice-of-anchor D domain-containing protein [Lujinxingia vulgaris]